MRLNRFAVLGAVLTLGSASYAGDTPVSGRAAARAAAVPSSELPRVGTVWDPPASSVDIALASDGSITFQGRPQGLRSLRQELRGLAKDPRTRQRDGLSSIDVVLRVASALPWSVVDWVLQVCADPDIRIYRVYFGVRPEANGADGVIPLFLPTEGPSPTDAGAGLPVKASLLASDRVANPGVVLLMLEAAFAKTTDRTLDIDMAADLAPRVGHVLSLIDLGFRAGAEAIRLSGTPAPFPTPSPPPPGRSVDHANEPGTVGWLRSWVAAKRALNLAGMTVRIGRATIDGFGLVVVGLPPPPARRPRVPAGTPVRPSARPAAPTDLSKPAAPSRPDDGTPLIGLGGGAGSSDRSSPPGSNDPDGPPDPEADKATERAFAWLAAHQRPDGSWACNAWPDWCDGKPVVHEPGVDGAGRSSYDDGVTALALLAFLGAGYTHRSEGAYGKVVGNALAHLRSVQDAEGCFGARTYGHYVYGHSIATLAAVEAYGMTGRPVYRAMAQKGLDFLAMARNSDAVWRYGVKPGDNDTSVTAWAALALCSASMINAAFVKDGREAPLTIDPAEVDGIRAWLEKVTDPANGRVGYKDRGSGAARTAEMVDKFPASLSESTTAIGVLLRVLLGESPGTSRPVKLGTALIVGRPPVWNTTEGSIDLYYWQFAALALVQVGGTVAETWRSALSKSLVTHQRSDGSPCGVAGSWDPVDPWGLEGGRVYATAMAALALEAPYRYPRIAK